MPACFWVGLVIIVLFSILIILAHGARNPQGSQTTAQWLVPSECEQCGNEIRRNYYTWTIDGREKVVCPECNKSLRRKASKGATR